LWEVGTWKPKGVLKGHTDCVCAVAFAHDGVLATGSFDHTVKVWDVENQRLYWQHEKNVGVPLAVAFLPPTGLLATAGVGRVIGVRSWDKDQKQVGYDLIGHRTWVNSICFNSRQLLLASGSSDGTIHLWEGSDKDVWNYKAMAILEGGAGEVRSVAFSPDGKLLAAGNRYGTVRVWDVASKKEIKTLTGHMGDVWSIAFSPDGKTLAAVDTDWKKPSKVKLYDTATWKERGSLSCPGEILSIAYSPKGDWLAAGSWDKTVRVFPVK
jgi:WD40 repeat protein